MIDQQVNDNYHKKLQFFKAMSELDIKEKKLRLTQEFIKAYFISVIIPPIGMYYFVKFVFFTESSDNYIKAGIISLVLTLLSLFLSLWLMVILFKQSTSTISPNDNQMLKDLMVPDNQKELFQLFK
jgi:hypothetical protein